MTRDSLSISRHIIFSTPVSLSVHDTERIDCLRLIGLWPPLPCKFLVSCKFVCGKRESNIKARTQGESKLFCTWTGVVGVWEFAFRDRTFVPCPSNTATVWHWPFSIVLVKRSGKSGFGVCFACCWYCTSSTLTTTNSASAANTNTMQPAIHRSKAWQTVKFICERWVSFKCTYFHVGDGRDIGTGEHRHEGQHAGDEKCNASWNGIETEPKAEPAQHHHERRRRKSLNQMVAWKAFF